MQGNQAAATLTDATCAPVVDGAFVIDKPEGWTSHDVVNKMRRIAGTKKVGHLGTLDPIATGVLPLLTGRATRLAQFFVRNDKIYEGVIRFGFATTTYDRAGDPLGSDTAPSLSLDEIEAALSRFRGKFEQTPPPVSAKKIGGVPAYKLARRNEAVELKPVEVHVYELTVLGYDGRDLSVRVHCSAGTYLRAIAHDAGQALGCGAHLAELRRTASGDFTIEQARTLEELADLSAGGRLSEALTPAADLIPQFPTQFVDDLVEGRIRQGRDFAVSPFHIGRAERYVKAVSRSGQLVAIGEMKLPNLCHPAIVL